MKKVKIYGTPTCPYCKMAKEFLAEKDVEYEDIDVSTNEAAREHLIKATSQMSVPVIEISEKGGDSEYVIGFDKEKLSQALGL